MLLQRNSRPSYSNEKSLNYTYFAFVLHVFLAYLGYFVTFTVTIKHREENGNRGPARAISIQRDDTDTVFQ